MKRLSSSLCCRYARRLRRRNRRQTAVDVVTLPVKVVSAGVDAATTSQSEADQKRGRELRKQEEERGRLAREMAERCRKGRALPTDDCRAPALTLTAELSLSGQASMRLLLVHGRMARAACATSSTPNITAGAAPCCRSPWSPTTARSSTSRSTGTGALEPWVERHVLPYLDTVPDSLVSPRLNRADAARMISHYLAGDDEPLIVADWPEDIALVQRALLIPGRGRWSRCRRSISGSCR